MTFSEAKPEERIAAVCRAVHEKFHPTAMAPDYADYRDALRPFIRREIILAKIEEARSCSSAVLTDRIADLARQLADVEREIPSAQRF
jgi:Mg-chelatase subunit ChlI